MITKKKKKIKSTKSTKSTKSIKLNNYIGGSQLNVQNPNEIKVVFAHGVYNPEKFKLNNGYNLIIPLNIGIFFYSEIIEYSEMGIINENFVYQLFDLIKSPEINFNLNNLFNLNNYKREVGNILTFKDFKSQLKDFQKKYNHTLIKYRRINREYNRIALEYGKRTMNLELVKQTLINLKGFMNTRLHIGKGQMVNNYLLTFNKNSNESEEFNKGILYKGNNRVSMDGLDETMLLSDIMKLKGPGTYYVLACREVVYDLNKEQIQNARILSGNQFNIDLFEHEATKIIDSLKPKEETEKTNPNYVEGELKNELLDLLLLLKEEINSQIISKIESNSFDIVDFFHEILLNVEDLEIKVIESIKIFDLIQPNEKTFKEKIQVDFFIRYSELKNDFDYCEIDNYF